MLTSILSFLNLGTGEIIIILVIVLLLFGARKIPELMRGLGRGVNSFKKGLNEVEEEIKDDIKVDADEPKAGTKHSMPEEKK